MMIYVFVMVVTDLSYYSGSSSVIKCKDGSKKINKSQLNDDFCDCPADGTDEPGLAYILVFWCYYVFIGEYVFDKTKFRDFVVQERQHVLMESSTARMRVIYLSLCILLESMTAYVVLRCLLLFFISVLSCACFSFLVGFKLY